MITSSRTFATSALKLLQGFGFSLQFALGFLLRRVFVVKVAYLLVVMLGSAALMLYCHFHVSSLEDGSDRGRSGSRSSQHGRKVAIVPAHSSAAD